MKVAINCKYGGFCLSAKLVKRLSELRGEPCYFFEDVWSEGDEKNLYVPLDINKIGNSPHGYWFAAKVSNPSEIHYGKNTIDCRDICRHDPLLIQAIEELGEDANSCVCQMKIVDIPDGVEYIIQENDGGIEWIAEKHRTWD